MTVISVPLTHTLSLSYGVTQGSHLHGGEARHTRSSDAHNAPGTPWLRSLTHTNIMLRTLICSLTLMATLHYAHRCTFIYAHGYIYTHMMATFLQFYSHTSHLIAAHRFACIRTRLQCLAHSAVPWHTCLRLSTHIAVVINEHTFTYYNTRLRS